jgi:uncharacterized protein YaaQ
MSYLRLIDNNLSKAFSLIKDLATDATFIKKSNTTFNFNTGIAKPKVSETVDAKVIIMDKLKRSRDRNTQSQQIMFKSNDVGDLTLYDSVIINEITWKLGAHIKNDGFINIIEISKEN